MLLSNTARSVTATLLLSSLKNSQGMGAPTEEEAQLQQLQVTHQIEMLRKEYEKADADVQLQIATAREKAAKADTLEGYRQMELEVKKLELQRAKQEQDVALRVALAARSHQNQNQLNQTRISGQMALKSMDLAMPKNEPKETPASKKEKS